MWEVGGSWLGALKPIVYVVWLVMWSFYFLWKVFRGIIYLPLCCVLVFRSRYKFECIWHDDVKKKVEDVPCAWAFFMLFPMETKVSWLHSYIDWNRINTSCDGRLLEGSFTYHSVVFEYVVLAINLSAYGMMMLRRMLWMCLVRKLSLCFFLGNNVSLCFLKS